MVTGSTTATISYIDTPVSQRVDHYSTTLLAFLKGNPVFSQSFYSPFSDATVQAAILQAEGILSGVGATFAGPVLSSSSVLLQSSLPTPPSSFTCLQAEAASIGFSGTTVTTTSTFGPATVSTGDCSSDSFFVLPGQLDINVNTDVQYTIPRNVVTTNIYLTTQTYEIIGTSVATNVPEPASEGFLLLALGAMVWTARVRLLKQSLSHHE